MRGRYINGRRTCAIGALIVASTKKNDVLRKEMRENNDMPISILPEMASHIRKVFGLSERQQRRIQSANDNVIGKSAKATKRRRAAVLSVVDSFIAK